MVLSADLEGILAWAGELLWAGFLVFLRVGAAMAVLPAFGEQVVPARVRLGLAIAFAAVVAPAVLDLLPARPAQPAALFALAAGEVAAGLALGLLLRLFVLALQIAGTIAAQAAMLTQLLGPVPGMDPSPAMGQLLVWAGLGLAATLGLHLQVAAYLIQGYALLPPGAVLDPGALLAVGVGEVGRSFALAFTLAAPFVAASLLANLVLGFINRAMPQLMVTFVGAPALIFGGLALLFLAAPIMLAAWIVAFGAALAAPFGGAP